MSRARLNLVLLLALLASALWLVRTSYESRRMFATLVRLLGDFDRKRIAGYLVHPLTRVRAGTAPRAAKVLVYGYPRWSHGRVYHDLAYEPRRWGDIDENSMYWRYVWLLWIPIYLMIYWVPRL